MSYGISEAELFFIASPIAVICFGVNVIMNKLIVTALILVIIAPVYAYAGQVGANEL